MQPYTFVEQTYHHNGGANIKYWYIKVEAQYLYPRYIGSNVCDTNYIGINGGFYSTPDDEAPDATDGRSIAWTRWPMNTDDVHEFNGSGSALNTISRGTLYCYAENNAFHYGVIKATSVNDVKSKIGVNKDWRYMIGGGDFVIGSPTWDWTSSFNSENWDFNTQYGPVGNLVECKRTGIGIKAENNTYYAYLVITADWNGTTLDNLREYIGNVLGCTCGIFLDGSASTQMRCYDASGNLKQEPGNKIVPTRRKVWNMISII